MSTKGKEVVLPTVRVRDSATLEMQYGVCISQDQARVLRDLFASNGPKEIKANWPSEELRKELVSKCEWVLASVDADKKEAERKNSDRKLEFLP